MRFSPKQKSIIRFDNQYKPKITILEGAVRSGKTFIDNWLWLNHVHSFKGKGYKFIMLGNTIASLKRNVLDDLELFPDIDTFLNKNNEFELFGNTVACFGADKADSYKAMKGFTAYGAYVNEATECHKKSIDQMFKRCSGEGARIFMDTNPAGPKHPIKTDIIDKDGDVLPSGKMHIKSWHFVLDDNIFLPEDYKESIKRATPSGMFYDRDINGLWVAAEGIIYVDFNYDKHTCSITDVPKVLKEYWAGVDWGYEHYGEIILFGKDNDGKVYQLKEIAAQRQDVTTWWVPQAKKINEKYGNIVYYCDDARPDNIATFRKAGLRAQPANKSVVEGISFVASYYKTDRISIVREENRHYLETVYNYRWSESASKEEPVKEDDDPEDAQRYGIYSHLFKKSGVEVLK